LSRKDRRLKRLDSARPSRRLKLFLEALDQRIVPSGGAATVSQSGNTLFITENLAFNDSISATSAFGGNYSVVTSANSGVAQNYSGVSNIVFNAATTGVSVFFNNSSGYNTAGNVSINGIGNFIGLYVEFDGSFNVNGKVSVANTGIGSSTDFIDLGDKFGGLTVAGGAAVTGANTFVSINDSLHNSAVTYYGNGAQNLSSSIQGTMVDLEGTTINGQASINFGAGGGYLITDYTLDLGNGSNDTVNGSASTVQISGNMSVTDLRTRFTDTFDLYNANVGGNLSFNISSLSASQAGVLNVSGVVSLLKTLW
jgi:hypothetical protein